MKGSWGCPSPASHLMTLLHATGPQTTPHLHQVLAWQMAYMPAQAAAPQVFAAPSGDAAGYNVTPTLDGPYTQVAPHNPNPNPKPIPDPNPKSIPNPNDKTSSNNTSTYPNSWSSSTFA